MEEGNSYFDASIILETSKWPVGQSQDVCERAAGKTNPFGRMRRFRYSAINTELASRPGEAFMSNNTPVVHTDPEILGGTPVFVGTRVPLRNLFDYLEPGHSLDEFLDAFPSVSREQAITDSSS